MDRRVFLALVLSAAVVVLTQLLFPPPRRVAPLAADSALVGAPGATPAPAPGAPGVAVPSIGAPPGAMPIAGAAPSASRRTGGDTTAASVAAETTSVATGRVHYRVSSLGATLLGAELQDYAALSQDGSRTGRKVELARAGDALVRFRLVVPGDTIALDEVPFTLASRTRDPAGRELLEYAAMLPAGMRVAVRYTFAPDSYLVHAAGRVEGAPAPAFLLLDLPRALASAEADTVVDAHARAIAYKPEAADAVGLTYDQLDAAEQVVRPGPITWAVSKNKYFIVGVLTPPKGVPFSELQVRTTTSAQVPGMLGGIFGTRVVPTAVDAVLVEPLAADGAFAFELYTGPQEFRRLEAIGREFETANPYGGILQGVVQPFATIVMRILLWLKATLGLGYGWILVIFGVTVRLLMWPLMHSQMKTSMRMQRLQPQMAAMQEKHRNDPQRLQQEMMKIYREHNLSPFSMFSGCLPVLITMPVFFALFYVFQNTIEFRGVPFLWLRDISIHDPLYIMPIVMGASSFLTMWIGMRNAPPNPQTKMMSYVFPVMMTAFLWKFASGMNLYYTVQNLAAVPQQWYLSRERTRAAQT